MRLEMPDWECEKMESRNYFGSMMVEFGEADAFITGYATKYPDALKTVIEVTNCSKQVGHIAGMYIMMTKKGPFFFADTTVNLDPDVKTLVDTTVLTAETLKIMNIEPKIAMVSYSNFGSTRKESAIKVSEAVKILHRDYPDLIVDGEMQANFALNPEMRQKKFPFSKLQDKQINTLIFPDLNSGNIAYKMLQEIGESEAIGPILMGIHHPIHILQLEASVREIVNMTAIAVVDAQGTQKK